MRRIGLKDVHVAKVTENTATAYTAEAPEKLFRGITAKVSVKKSSEKLYSDDEVEDILSALDGIEVELEGDSLTMAKIAALRGAKLTKGMLVDNKDDEAAEVAIGWRAKNAKGKYQFVWLYCGKFAEGDDEEYETQAEKPNPKTATLKGTFYARSLDGNYRVRVHENELVAGETEAKAVLAKWFTEVPEPLEETAGTRKVELNK